MPPKFCPIYIEQLSGLNAADVSIYYQFNRKLKGEFVMLNDVFTLTTRSLNA
ncbi:hypothetical protein LTWDN19_17330 [Latilactobacillus curvatus]|uniref:Uncharacterized protein n=1 Tax=Latilactobacillus curvatus TaxID=28038 RepID=A0ABM7QVZ3_LATCU|nr:hypothetical protein LTWDN19_17330 [Latilactobacillus curvatus]